jgi:hypothetical protein
MSVQQYIEPELEKGRVVIMTSLDAQRAFDAAFWPVILKGQSDENCTQNFYKLMQVYLLINIKISMEFRTVSSVALCVITGMTPIHLKIETAADIFRITRGQTREINQFE